MRYPPSLAIGSALALLACGTATALTPFGGTGQQHGAGTLNIQTTTKQAVLRSVTAAAHPTFDRVVWRFSIGTPAWRAQYVAHPVKDPSGLPVTIAGSRFLEISFTPARRATSGHPGELTPRLPNVRQTTVSGDFEAVTTVVVGLKARRSYRVFRLANPPRIVLDVRR